ncbi:DUF5008 domain-containing protein [Mucilaginibacter pocheonensis]|uniref:DUF5008 domain-containing protein n=1 Tax=Mucilaginibacter pocheonensis TaxID=398050 RepID=A0ABU1T6U6_9SPHI|nr:DUF5008 domain-containing protein [Mucilaginibacter pocheonensis]MDR6941023.1 hypothetical protein [Mucilaginibacter pocheonensis]
MRKIKLILILVALWALAGQSCKKEQKTFEDPYADGKSPLGAELSRNTVPVPASGVAGTEVTFKATGLLPFKDKLKFMFNGEPGDIVSVTETQIKVKVPAAGSSGITTIAIGDQLILGPEFTVTGFIKFDPSFRATLGANGFVSQVFELVDGRNLVIGGFTNYDNKGIVTPLNRIVRTSADGEFDRTFRTGKAANGTLARIIEMGGKYVIVGGFSGYNQRTENISNITTLNTNGSIDTLGIKVFKRPSQADTTRDTIKNFPKFNGGANDFISNVYKQQNKILATGNFRYYVKRTYGKPNHDLTRDTVILDSTEIRQIMRLNTDGSLDKTFRFNAGTNKGLPGANGPIGSFMHTEADKLEKLVVFGSFTTFDGKPAGRIIRLDANGNIDNSFNPGSGADNGISSLTYNAATKKYVITGIFKKYNGHPAPGIALLNDDGSFDNSFVCDVLEGGYASFARQLSDGLIVVSGGFQKYSNVTRNGFMVLTSTGKLAAGYNATGPFLGSLLDAIETKSADNKRALLLIGGFYRFDNQRVSNIIRVIVDKP